MKHIVEQQQDEVLVVTMASGKANALHSAMVDELLSAVRRASTDPAVQGLVLASDRPRFFSAGFDVMRVFEYDRPAMSDFFGRFIDLYEALLAMPKPVVAALSGHTVAGGAVLALTADERVMCEGDSRFALNEVDLGIELPPKIVRMVIAAGGFRIASDILLACVPVMPARALEIGIAQEVAPVAEVLDRAVARCRNLARKPKAAFATIKRHLQEEARISRAESDRASLPEFLDQWFSPEACGARQALLQSMKR